MSLYGAATSAVVTPPLRRRKLSELPGSGPGHGDLGLLQTGPVMETARRGHAASSQHGMDASPVMRSVRLPHQQRAQQRFW